MSVLRFKDPATGEWKEITTIMGPPGPKGDDGTLVFEELTEEQREQLRGPKGEDGAKGDQGEVGPQGPAGQDGKDYVLTDADKQEIAGLVEVPEPEVNLNNYYTKAEIDAMLPASGEEVSY